MQIPDKQNGFFYSRIFIGVLICLFTLAIAGFYWRRYHNDEKRKTLLALQSASIIAQRADIEETLTAKGNVVQQDYVDVTSLIPGRISHLFANVGDTVKQGKLLALITPAARSDHLESNRAQLARLKAELAGQNAELDFAQLQFHRQTQLKAENATHEEAYEASRSAMYSAAAKVDAINAQIQQLQVLMKADQEIQKHTKIVAPISGTVIALSAHAGQVVTDNQEAIMRIAKLDKMNVQAQVAEEDVTHLTKGMTAYFTTPGYPDKRWAGQIQQIIPVPIKNTGKEGKKAYYTVIFEVPNPHRELMSGMSAEVFFILGHAEQAVTIPVKLIDKPASNGEQILMVLGPEGKTEIRKVKVGIRNDQQAQIISGLKAGERVLSPSASETSTTH